MELYFFRHDEYERLYNCNMYRVEEVPLEKRQNTYLGMAFLVLFFVFMVTLNFLYKFSPIEECKVQILYMGVIIAIYKRINQTCYKFLFFIGVTDIACLPICGLVTGYMAMEGAVFCSHPTFLYFCGVFGNLFWVTESTTAIILAVNRCLQVISPEVSKKLFFGHRVWYWMCIATCYGLWSCIFTRAVSFNGIFCAWFFNPHTGYIEDTNGTYANLPHTFHNYMVCLALTGLYLVFIIAFLVKHSISDKANAVNSIGTKNAAKKTAFIQVALLSCVNAVGSGIYDYLQYFPTKPIFIYVASYCWLLVHGIPSVIFLTMNKTIRNDCIPSKMGLFSALHGIAGTDLTNVTGHIGV
ncbi:serpentine type 7TM GPCR chemoreceptor srt domain-containing protein [Ditylenchus destructor]|uniref:Serpentine type 7TM GPCR chemoreceptor srt domain-containing protein n=1 Tax=Ditylenchus destructor TaxID=166010 RepID=A0AAD4MMV4_9BILA|nr:serpentine type 7TM GPCR chemoreceptor srt domain-containing protein [Ditylenchus destructor]